MLHEVARCTGYERDHIRALFAENRGAYGWPRTWRDLRAQGIRVGKLRVQRLMQRNSIPAPGKHRFRITTTDSRHGLLIAANLPDRNFTMAAPKLIPVGDATYIATQAGWPFLAVVMDLFSRRIGGWSLVSRSEARWSWMRYARPVPTLPRLHSILNYDSLM